MSVLLTLLGAVAGIVVGGAAGMFFVLIAGPAMGLSDFQGERAMTAAFLGAPAGAVIGAILGVILVRRLKRD